VAQQRDGSQQGNHYFTMPMKINFIGKALWIDISSSVLSGGGTNLATGA
jgi:hypothetical protein